jgi:MFS family permease
MIFGLMILTNILINLDHGILPACTSQMEEEFGMDEFELGLLGSIVYLGISIMGLFAGRLYQHFNSKLLTVIALILLELSLTLFVMSSHKVTAYLSRFATGVCQVFLLVYYPIWIDKYGKDKKTMWLTLLQICVPVGIFMGYGMTAVIISTGNHVISIQFSTSSRSTSKSDWWLASSSHSCSCPSTSWTVDAG